MKLKIKNGLCRVAWWNSKRLWSMFRASGRGLRFVLNWYETDTMPFWDYSDVTRWRVRDRLKELYLPYIIMRSQDGEEQVITAK